MNQELLILISEALVVYAIVLWTHSLRHRFGLPPFYALLGGITAIMSWITDAGIKVEFSDITFMIGSTVFYTSLLLGVFVVYVFDGPRATRIAISTVAGVSVMVPLIALVLNLQIQLAPFYQHIYIPSPSLRINTASVFATITDLFFLGIAWEALGKSRFSKTLWIRAFLTLLGVMWLDVILFATGAFAGTPEYSNIMKGTLLSRFIVSIFACPILFLYLNWQNKIKGIPFEDRPVLAIIKEITQIKVELTLAQQEIEKRKKAEKEKEELIIQLKQALNEIKTLEGFLPICANCKKIRDDKGYWQQLEHYIQSRTEAKFTHAICPECTRLLYPDLKINDK